jgi:NADH-quinone oxidoreductase subunit M
MPVFAVLFLLMTLSSIGMPAIPGNGFVGEWTVLLGAFQLPSKLWAVLAATGIVLGAVYMLWLYQRTMFGPIDRDENRTLTDLGPREVLTLVPLTILAFWIGLYPRPVFQVLDEPVTRLVQQINKTYAFPEDVVVRRALGGPAPPVSAEPAAADRAR